MQLQWALPAVASLMFPLLVVGLGLGMMVLDPKPVQGLRNHLFDQYQRWKPRAYTEAPVRVIDIDEESIQRLGQWPWPRTRMAELVEVTRQAGVAALGFDVVFSEADRTSPKSMVPLWFGQADLGEGTRLRDQLLRLPDHDEALRHAIESGGVVVGFALTAQTEAGSMPLRHVQYVQKGPSGVSWLGHFNSAITSLPPLQQAAAGNGGLNFLPDEDGVLRRVPLVLRFQDQLLPSFVAELLRVGQGERNVVLSTEQVSAEESRGFREVRLGGLSVPTTEKGEVWVHYAAPQPARYLSAWKVLAGEVPKSELEGNLVLVGTSAQGLMDLRFSPLGSIIPGVEVHAQALEQILSGKHLVRPGWAQSLEVLLALVAGLVVGALALNARALLAAMLSLQVMASVFALGWLMFSQYQLLLDPLTPSLVVLASFVLCSLVHHFRSERQQRWVTEAFSRYVSPNKVDFLVKHPGQLKLGGARQMCSFIFTDLQGFTGLMESMDPGAAVSSLNAYLDGMVAIAFKHEGTLDRIMGDAVAVVFSAPVEQVDHIQRAFDCAMEMHAFGRQYAKDLQAKGIRFGNTRIGVHSGEVIVGNFGGSTMFDYRALGDPVNTAARLESVNKHLGTLICVSEVIYLGCADMQARPVGRLVLKGKKLPLMVYEPVAPGDAFTRAPLEDYKAVYALLAAQRLNGLDPAPTMARLAGLALQYPHDPLVRLHLDRLQRGELGDEIVMAEK
ncbi:MAG: hypothetical protein RLZZ401_2017 [Pseudomonadota bacterium]